MLNYQLFAIELDELSAKYFNHQYDDFIRAQAHLARIDASKQTDENVKNCLLGMAELLDQAAMNFEISFK